MRMPTVDVQARGNPQAVRLARGREEGNKDTVVSRRERHKREKERMPESSLTRLEICYTTKKKERKRRMDELEVSPFR